METRKMNKTEYKSSSGFTSASPSKTDFYKTAKSANGETTLRARLVTMHETIMELIANIQQVRKEVKAYKGHLDDWKENERVISLKERNEQQANAKRVEEEIKRAFSLQDIENYRLNQQMQNLKFDKDCMQKNYLSLDKEYKELDFVIGQEDAPKFPPEAE